MHVEDVAIYDSAFTPETLRERIAAAAPAMKENLAQIGAVSAICNAAIMVPDTAEKPQGEREIMGDATGKLPLASRDRQ